MQAGTQVNTIALVVRPIMSASYSTADSEKVQIAEIEIADETASILLRLVNGKAYLEQCECAIGNSTIVIRNGFVSTAGNLLRIEVEKHGSVKKSTVNII